MRKVFVVAMREYNAAVRTKAFVIGLIMMPIMMGGSIGLQWLLKDDRERKPRTMAVMDRTPGAVLLPRLSEAIERHNESIEFLDAEQKRYRGKVILDERPPPVDDAESQAMERELNREMRTGKIGGWLMIGPDVTQLAPPTNPEELPRYTVFFRSSRPSDREIGELFRLLITDETRAMRSREAGLSPEKVRLVSRPVLFNSQFDATMFLPLGMMMLMFMLILMAATPLMQGVVEEKMQRIAEVLLGSVTPFQLMLGKLLGMTGVSLTISSVYLAGAYWAAWHYGFADLLSISLLVWFILYQMLASLMFGSLFIAVGAACTDVRETQNLIWPVMLLATLPMFFLGPLLRSPNSPIVIGTSYFPFATPSMMIARMGMPDAVQWWEPYAGASLMLLTTLLCVWVAGRIFRVGILLMGKGAQLGELIRWVVRG